MTTTGSPISERFYLFPEYAAVTFGSIHKVVFESYYGLGRKRGSVRAQHYECEGYGSKFMKKKGWELCVAVPTSSCVDVPGACNTNPWKYINDASFC